MKKNYIIFFVVFIAGIIVCISTPAFVDIMISVFEEIHTERISSTGKLIDTLRVERLTPYFATSGYIVSAGLQLLGISGIVATILKKDD